MKLSEFLNKKKGVGRREFLKTISVIGGTILLSKPLKLFAQAVKKRISIATGGMGGVYFVIGGGIASILTKYAGVEAAAEVTSASVDNCKLIAANKSEFAIILADTGYDAYKGLGSFKGKELPIRTVAVLYPGLTHVVTLAGKGIKRVADLKGKRVSVGAPGSGTEVIALRVLAAAGLNHEKDIKKDRLGAGESGGALKDGKIDAYFWTGGVPTSSVLDVASSPGINMALVPQDDIVPKLSKKFGPIYYKSIIPKNVYTGVKKDTPIVAVGNVLMCHKDLDEKLVYNVVKTLYAHLKELAAIHKEALHINLKDGSSSKAVPYHKGAAKFFKEMKFNVPV